MGYPLGQTGGSAWIASIAIGLLASACNSSKPAAGGGSATAAPSGSAAVGSSAAPSGSAAPAAPSAAPPAAPAPAADPGFGDVAFKTFSADGARIVFTSPTKAKRSWPNMVGKDVVGTYTQTGRELEIKWDPTAKNYHFRDVKFRQMGPCSMAQYSAVDDKGVVHDDSPEIYQQVEPRCDTVRLTK